MPAQISKYGTITNMTVKKAIIPAAGQGTRLGAITRSTPKELVPLLDRPAIDWVIDEIRAAGIDDICVVTSPGKSHALSTHLSEFDVQFRIQEHPMGLGHAVLAARDFAGDDDFAVVLPDDLVLNDPILSRLSAYTERSGLSALALTEVPTEMVSRYGVASGSQTSVHFSIDDLVEKPAPGTEPSNLTITGRYVLTRAIWPLLAQVKPGRGGEIQLTDALAKLARNGELSGLVTNGQRHDLGSPASWLAANIAVGLQEYGINWMRAQIASHLSNS